MSDYRITLYLSLIVVTLLLGACGSAEIAEPTISLAEAIAVETVPSESLIPFTTLEQNDWGYGENLYGSYEEPKPDLFVIKRYEDIDLVSEWIPPETRQKLRAINYDSDLALIVFQGWMPSSDYGVNIDRLSIQNDIVNVFTSFKKPEPGKEVHATETSPYHVIMFSKPVNWDETVSFNLIIEGGLSQR